MAVEHHANNSNSNNHLIHANSREEWAEANRAPAVVLRHNLIHHNHSSHNNLIHVNNRAEWAEDNKAAPAARHSHSNHNNNLIHVNNKA